MQPNPLIKFEVGSAKAFRAALESVLKCAKGSIEPDKIVARVEGSVLKLSPLCHNGNVFQIPILDAQGSGEFIFRASYLVKTCKLLFDDPLKFIFELPDAQLLKDIERAKATYKEAFNVAGEEHDRAYAEKEGLLKEWLRKPETGREEWCEVGQRCYAEHRRLGDIAHELDCAVKELEAKEEARSKFRVETDFSFYIVPSEMCAETNSVSTETPLYPNLSIETAILLELFSKTVPFASAATEKENMNLVDLRFEEGQVVCWATDAHKLTKAGAPFQTPAEWMGVSLKIPLYFAKDLLSISKFKKCKPTKKNHFQHVVHDEISDSMELSVCKRTVTDNLKIDSKRTFDKLTILAGSKAFTTGLCDVNTPPYEICVPESSSKKAIINRKELIGSLKRAVTFSNNYTHLVVFQFAGNILTLSAEDQEFSTNFHEQLHVLYDMDELKIGLDARLLLSILEQPWYEYEDMVMEMETPGRAVVVIDGCNRESWALLMPVMLGNYYSGSSDRGYATANTANTADATVEDVEDIDPFAVESIKAALVNVLSELPIPLRPTESMEDYQAIIFCRRLREELGLPNWFDDNAEYELFYVNCKEAVSQLESEGAMIICDDQWDIVLPDSEVEIEIQTETLTQIDMQVTSDSTRNTAIELAVASIGRDNLIALRDEANAKLLAIEPPIPGYDFEPDSITLAEIQNFVKKEVQILQCAPLEIANSAKAEPLTTEQGAIEYLQSVEFAWENRPASPCVWVKPRTLTDAQAAELKKIGFVWSGKREQWYFVKPKQVAQSQNIQPLAVAYAKAG